MVMIKHEQPTVGMDEGGLFYLDFTCAQIMIGDDLHKVREVLLDLLKACDTYDEEGVT